MKSKNVKLKICVGAVEEWARKVYALRGLRGVERQVVLTRGTQWPVGSSAAVWWQEKQDEVIDRSRWRVAAHDRSLHAGVCGGSPENRRVTWLSHKTKTRGSAGGDGIRARRSFDVGGRVAGSWGLRREDAVCGDGVAVRWRGVLHDLFAPEGFVSQLKC
jgi:hypothetical protein